jgi:hypothetical protein
MRSNATGKSWVAAGLLAIAGMASAPAIAQQECPPSCGLEIELPADAAAAPGIPDSQKTIIAIRGAAMLAMVSDRRGQPDKAATKLVFRKAAAGEQGEPYTPFVDSPGPNGKPITEVHLKAPGATRLFIREDEEHECFEAPGCKFDIVNEGDPERPVLDPYIIIKR